MREKTDTYWCQKCWEFKKTQRHMPHSLNLTTVAPGANEKWNNEKCFSVKWLCQDPCNVTELTNTWSNVTPTLKATLGGIQYSCQLSLKRCLTPVDCAGIAITLNSKEEGKDRRRLSDSPELTTTQVEWAKTRIQIRLLSHSAWTVLVKFRKA